MNPIFNLGRCVATPGALELLATDGVEYVSLLDRHCTGDWGDIQYEDDKRANDYAIDHALRIMSAYKLKSGTVWITTEADRSSTTMLLPEEY